MNPIFFISLVVFAHELGVYKEELKIRRHYYDKAYRISRRLGKPLLVIGTPRGKHGCGDIMLDIKPIGECPFEIVGDVRNLSRFKEKQFVVYCSHVIEHLELEDAKRALREIERISEYAVIIYPTDKMIYSRICPEHKIETLRWLWSINPKGVIELY